MLEITIPGKELYDEANNEFINVKGQTLKLEHSLVSLSKWESKWHKPFLKTDMTVEETLDYIRCMTITQNVNPLVYNCITNDNVRRVIEYIEDPMTARKFPKLPNSRSHEIITAEDIYYWMISFGIPSEYQKWHLNRLLNLIKVCNDKNTPPKKMSKQELMARNRALNEERKKALNTKG